MNNYVLVLDAFNSLCPRPYIGNVLLLNEGIYRHYLVEKDGIFTLFNTSVNDDAFTSHKIRCPRCSSQLVKISTNKYKCIICEGR